MRNFHLHLISDSTGETVSTVSRAVAALFKDVDPIEHSWSLIRTTSQIDKVLAGIREHPGVVLYTLVGDELQVALSEGCRLLGVPCISVLDQVIDGFSAYLGAEQQHRPGGQHALDKDYFDRMDAIQFTLHHDDGQLLGEVHNADVILVGVSRTSKTPTSLYLANRGIKVANVPLVPGYDPPEQVMAAEKPLIIGLTSHPEALVQVRRSRLKSMNAQHETDYIALEAVRTEVRKARRLFSERGWPVIDVSHRSIEETAAEILALHRSRLGLD